MKTPQKTSEFSVKIVFYGVFEKNTMFFWMWKNNALSL